ncbi:hypothetical protein [Actinomadura sp. NEAU-AAG7]|uniref:hypothetical protein n=1 Tax=Actinomadura sp. NEAU-AAG7 TaxID=2839640 RepID=UPI001BE42EAA|nr:hypothetical protein [Actinomadura sp. NEAU-AAG7]MBT2209630.1 hypothetical protein [Actinomadura sp. NEAU-AAG7]
MNEYSPPRERDLDPAAGAVRRRHLVEEISRPAGRRRIARRGPWIAGGVAALVLAGGGVAVAGGLLDDGVEQSLATGCYARADLQADTTAIGTGTLDPVGECAGLWREGVVREGTRTAPPLVACGMDKAVGVFPGDSGVCRKLGLRPWRPLAGAERTRAQALARLRKELVAGFSARCVSERRSIALAEGRLAANGLPGWRVVTAEFGRVHGRDGRCASFGDIDPETRTITLTGVPAE